MGNSYYCEIGKKEISKEWVDFHEQIYNYHFFCSVHGDLFRKAKVRIEITWNNEKKEFEVIVHD